MIFFFILTNSLQDDMIIMVVFEDLHFLLAFGLPPFEIIPLNMSRTNKAGWQIGVFRMNNLTSVREKKLGQPHMWSERN